ncbi:HNH endonuclease signature motif containing protein [Georgenia ruanii]|uniref:HNH endonuclease signature motif containing protein n=1 Tax=Georgenia ruanii TaxID=348442 RepID=UPI00186B47A3|nr:HNH endonuclease signature motif containing protein [Georgenia ruanii]
MSDSTSPPGGPVPASDEALVDELTTVAAHIAAATCRFLVLLGEFDAREAWGEDGILSAAHWLGWRCGMGPVAAREHVRVARALRALPVTVRAFAQGRLSYSKVRAITRVATPQTEADLVDVALHAPAHHLERLVRGLRTTQTLEDSRERHARRHLSWRWADDGSLLLSGRFSPEDGALIVQALEVRRDRAEAELADTVPPEADAPPRREDEPPDPTVADRRSLADALVELCAEAPVPGDDRPRTSRSPETVVHVTLADLRSPTAPVDTVDTAPAVDGNGTAPLMASDAAPPPQALATESLVTTPRLDDGPALHPETARRLACDAGIVVEVHDDGVGVSGRTLEVGAKVRKPTAALIRALWGRDRGCRYPGCTRRHFLQAHHVLHWADGGLTVITNMVLLCGTNHRLLHEGQYSLTLDPDGSVTVRDRRGAIIHPVPAQAGRLDGWRPAVAVDAATLTPEWSGEPLDTAYATTVLLESWALAEELAAADAEDPEPAEAAGELTDPCLSQDQQVPRRPHPDDGRRADCESVDADGGDDS